MRIYNRVLTNLKLGRNTCILLLCFILLAFSSENNSGTDKSLQDIKKDIAEPNPKAILEKVGFEYAYPHFSKDATKILFQSNESNNWRLCIVDIDGSNMKEITTDSASSYFPDWSPDNNLICFVSDRTGYEEIYLMNTDGTNQQQLTNNQARNIHPYFSPNGKQVLFSSTFNSDNFEIYRMNVDGSGVRRITYSPDNETCARMSPDKKYITFLRNNDKGLDDLFLLSLSDSAESNLTNTKTLDGWPTWTPDGKHIIYSAMQNDSFKLFAYNLNTKKLIQLTNSPWPINDCRANVSGNGEMIVFNRQHDDKDKRTNAIYLLHL